ncbi:MAG TPA: M4 family metallopeptidase [Thermoanaerobaculia bacterium]|jgi:Zn-dependent metalloprotease|nr:M4 family metallopeptidase [Thermoanaerobaculia bacterium]
MGNSRSVPRSVAFVRSLRWIVLLLAVPALAAAAEKGNGKGKTLDPAGIERLKGSAAGRVRVSTSESTGAVRFAGVEPGERGDLMPAHRGTPAEKSRQFLRENSSVFGLVDADAELQLGREQTDELGNRHLTFFQSYRGVPVFAGVLRAHVDAAGELTAVNGNVVPDLRLSITPTRPATEASATAIGAIAADNPGREVFARSGLLMIYRTGLAQGIDGENHLTWQIEVGNDADIREFVYVDAHSGKIVDRLPGIIDNLYRRAYDGQNLNQVPPSYPGSPFWVEGDAFPTSSAEANNMITSSKETYDFYKNAFGRDSFDGNGATMDSIFNRGYACPNASWNGTFISFCPGFTVDDVTAHEWTHAYTQYTHGLIYAWQPGALNESYSDIFGETIDLINGRGTDSPNTTRTADACSVFFGTPPPVLTITGGAAAGNYFSRASVNEPAKPFTIGPTDMAVAVTAAPFQPAGACGAVSGVSGKIAIVDWTLTSSGGNECGSGARATNVANAGATGIVFVAPASGILNLGSIPSIGSVEVTRADGNKIIAGLPAQATMTLGVGTDNSYRWLIGEDVTNPQSFGALRDMANPRCFGNPGKVSDTFEYTCSTADNGGVHTNSGVPNHAYELIVDGGTYNGQTLVGLGLIKAAHIYFRAMTVYQHPTTTFADHADAIEQSAADLIGVNLPDLNTGAPSGQIITAADVDQVKKAMLAVEMRNPPTQCGFQPLLAQNPPALCAAPLKEVDLFQDKFETTPPVPWTVSHEAVSPADFTPRDWQIVGSLPDGRTGHAFFALDPTYGTCAPGGDESGVLHLTSPQIVIPASATNAQLTFMHWVASEAGFDGGNLWISVNGGPYKPIAPADFIYNAYNRTLVTAAAGNTDPLAGQPAWSGTDGGAVDGSWGRSIVNLAPYAKAKDKIRLRFDFGNDGCGGVFGWYVDDVTVYRCK